MRAKPFFSRRRNQLTDHFSSEHNCRLEKEGLPCKHRAAARGVFRRRKGISVSSSNSLRELNLGFARDSLVCRQASLLRSNHTIFVILLLLLLLLLLLFSSTLLLPCNLFFFLSHSQRCYSQSYLFNSDKKTTGKKLKKQEGTSMRRKTSVCDIAEGVHLLRTCYALFVCGGDAENILHVCTN